MPPQITFINVAKEVVIPVKIFIKSIPQDPTTSSLSINEKSPITIHNIHHAKLNDSQIQKLVNSISLQIKNAIFYDLHDHQLRQQQESHDAIEEGTDRMQFGDGVYNNEDHLKTSTFKVDNLKVVVPVDVVYQVRYKLGLVEYDEARKYLRDCGFNLVVVKEIPKKGERSQKENEDDVLHEDINENTGLDAVDVAETDKGEGSDEMPEVRSEETHYSAHVFNGKQIIGDFATCIKVYVH
ncbi:hypothetical protein KGF57_002642 [Candida theae]|uniref:Uncharacterized protein n=1 Tax=Candida theae TaxID=1198502 RepID=A0AAD5BFE3_9ASCO|nr:uncharacterized protein KGF57_002642 [Candida theae]KAI5958287.1 hypothetical protein KGF57_002642 [Candida theae]